ncbi:hypothetical protein [Halopiger xanaduensis]|uniref:Uncharacterized protein n=1 Tax=Halopiger xanaduensis (strain DSM 18323 / JCM 14033 / SH-6) TaxID=797210 RepID=F8DEQ7_HALXS|nr:hypothetical protein [Halopiger xanaduensis]AEH39494.1 hypothetical protein Halxa_0254 [Halopiger xanaduensis SH-6]
MGSDDDRRCTTCGKSVADLPYEYWAFKTCRSCAADASPDRWGDGRSVGVGTYRKWRYFPRWHMTRHPDLPEHVRARHGGVA